MSSRSQTVIDAVIRTQPITNQKKLIFHFVGADNLETVHPELEFEELFNALSNKYRQLNQLEMIFIGPNINKEFRKIITYNGIEVKLISHAMLYHDYFFSNIIEKDQFIQEKEEDKRPHMLILFNAGLWGYDDWIPTIKLFNHEYFRHTIVLITSYTIEECEDDEDKVNEITNNTLKWIWLPRINLHKNNIIEKRNTRPNQRINYYENYATMCLECLPLEYNNNHNNHNDDIIINENSTNVYDNNFGLLLNPIIIKNVFQESLRPNYSLLSLLECKCALIRLLGIELSRSIIKRIIENISNDNIKVIPKAFIDEILFNQVVNRVVNKHCEWDMPERILFNQLKSSKDLFITSKSFSLALQEIAPHFSKNKADKIFQVADEHGFQKLTLPQYKRTI